MQKITKNDPAPSILMLGTRGLPAAHGGFETFVENLAPYLAERGWDVSVYCQEEGDKSIWEDRYRGVNLINVPVKGGGIMSTIKFDWIALNDALSREGLLLSFGYPTGAFAFLPWIKGRRHVINMDGIEWKRSQFGLLGRAAYYVNERFAAIFGNRLIADHPEIAKHLATRVSSKKITTIAYGADVVNEADINHLQKFNIEASKYAIIIARPEPDNSIVEIVRAFSRKKRKRKLVVLGNYKNTNKYHQEVRSEASDEVIFPGAIYDQKIVRALRFYARFYAHGHRVGGTNPSLVEALGAGSAVMAHDNSFNKWVAGEAAVYFKSEKEIGDLIERLFRDDILIDSLKGNAREKHKLELTWMKILGEYADLLTKEINH